MKPHNLVLSLVLVLSCQFLDSVLSSPYHGIDEFGYNGIGEYYSKPKYAFGYEVDGLDKYFRELSHGRWEIRDGDVTQGQYRVLLPDGRIQIVSYVADRFGYRPNIQYINKGSLPPPPPPYATGVEFPKFVPIPEPIPPPVPVVFEPEPHHHNLYSTYGPGYGYGFDPFLALGSTNTNAQSSGTKTRTARSRVVVKKRPIAYDRTLFRKDVERKRRSQSIESLKNNSKHPISIPNTASQVGPIATINDNEQEQETIAPRSGRRAKKISLPTNANLTPAQAYHSKNN